MFEIVKPNEIEKKSFEIITSELGGRTFAPEIEPIVKRVIHTSADFDYADNLVFTDGAVPRALEALKNGAHIVTDTTMAMSGINKRTLAALGGEVHCFIGDEDVAQQAKERGVTRSMVSMEKAAAMEVPLIFAIGNAPTALISLCELMDRGAVSPELVIGVPVGFVNVVESKELVLEHEVPAIVARGRKGGSNVAAAIVNALLYQVRQREGF
ncbi:MAG: precorrin-8X methylmutase [Butyricicoccaceae bacterium]